MIRSSVRHLFKNPQFPVRGGVGAVFYCKGKEDWLKSHPLNAPNILNLLHLRLFLRSVNKQLRLS